MKQTIILGIDPGLANTGFGLIEFNKNNDEKKVIDYGFIKTNKNEDYDLRLEVIYKNIVK